MDSNTTNIQPHDSTRALLSEIIDYAGLFPPSQVSMAEAVLNYATYKSSNYNWLLGRFVVPAARLDDFLENTGDFVPRKPEKSWRLSVLAGENLTDSIRRIQTFNEQNSPRIACDVLELKAFTASEIENAVNAIPDYLTAYFEIPIDHRLADLVTELAIRRQRAKIRTGGVTNDAFPTTAEIIRFIRTCLAANVPFKATAGLHHALRCFKPLTYESNAPMGAMHGFLNLFLAVGFARQGFKPSLLESLLEDEFAESFEFTEGAVTWHRDYILTAAQIAQTRRSIISFGSCSFDEPVADLQEMKIL